MGDLIVRVADRAVETWEDVFLAVMPRADKEIELVVRNASGESNLKVTPDSQTSLEMGDLGVGPTMSPQLRGVTSGEPADLAGIQVGDIIEAIEGDVLSSDELVERINAHPEESLRLTVRRNEMRQDIMVTPALKGDVGLIGVSLSPYEVRTIEPGFVEAFQLSLERNYEWSGLIFNTLIGLFTAETSPKQLVGPVGIAQLSGGAAEMGLVALLSLMSMISLNLGILNLLLEGLQVE